MSQDTNTYADYPIRVDKRLAPSSSSYNDANIPSTPTPAFRSQSAQGHTQGQSQAQSQQRATILSHVVAVRTPHGHRSPAQRKQHPSVLSPHNSSSVPTLNYAEAITYIKQYLSILKANSSYTSTVSPHSSFPNQKSPPRPVDVCVYKPNGHIIWMWNLGELTLRTDMTLSALITEAQILIERSCQSMLEQG